MAASERGAEDRLDRGDHAAQVQDTQIIRNDVLLLQVIQSLPYPVYIIDMGDYTITRVNSAGSTGSLAEGAKCYQVIAKRDEPCHESTCLCPIEEIRRTGRPSSVDCLARDEEGNTRDLEYHAYPAVDGTGKLTHLISCAVDITERKRYEQALLVSERRYSALIENIPIGLVLASLDGEIVQCNRAMAWMTGYSETELSGMNIQELWHGSEECAAHWERITRGDLAAETECGLACRDGTPRAARLTLFRFSVDGSDLIMLSAVDITRRAAVQAALRRTTEALRERQASIQKKSLAVTALVEEIAVEKQQLKDAIGANIRELILPIVEKLRLTGARSDYLDILEHELEHVAGDFGIRIARSTDKLSPRQIEISSMIEYGLTTKEIAQLLGISYQTVERHRRNIRKSVGITGKRVSLSSYLKSDL